MFYDRKIRYLDYFEDGARVKGGGFVKLEARDSSLRMEVKVAGLHRNDSVTCDVVLRGLKGEGVSGKIVITRGEGLFTLFSQSLKDIAGTGIGYEELQGIRISLGSGREISSSWPIQGMAAGTGKYGTGPGGSASRQQQSKGSANRQRETQPEEETYRGVRDSESREGTDSGWRGSESREGTSSIWRGSESREGTSSIWRGSESRERTDSGWRDAESREGTSSGWRDADSKERTDSGWRDADSKERTNSGWRDADSKERTDSGWRDAGSKERTDSGWRDAESRERTDSGWRDSVSKEGTSTGWRGSESSEGTINLWRESELPERTVEQPEEPQRTERSAHRQQEPAKLGRTANTQMEPGEAERNTDRRKGTEGAMNSQGELKAEENRSSRKGVQDCGRGTGVYSRGQKKPNGNSETGVRRMWEVVQEEPGTVVKKAAETPGRRTAGAGMPVKLLEDKWMQICAIYPHIHPFHDKREYLSISPADFVLFSAASYKMINNSFLLHGYYNYHHLILTRVEQKGEYRYYIGVPGSYFEKEKQVAIMFGFESFECGEEPAQVGDFGYYMMRAEL